jgi:hypothetical protein
VNAGRIQTKDQSLLQQKRRDELLRFIGIDEAAADLKAVIAADELVVDELTAAIAVFHKGCGVAIRAGSDDTCGIG